MMPLSSFHLGNSTFDLILSSFLVTNIGFCFGVDRCWSSWPSRRIWSVPRFVEVLNIDNRQSEIENTSYNKHIKGCLPLNYSPDEFHVTSLIDAWLILKCLNRMRILTFMKRLSKSKIEQAYFFGSHSWLTKKLCIIGLRY